MDTLFICKQFSVFVFMWFTYATCYFLRRPIGLIKDDLQQSMSVSDDALGYLDFAYALPYSFCSVTLSFVGDIFGPRKALAFGMIGSAVASSIMGKVTTYFQLCILFALSGSFQALCWPSACTIVSSWFNNNKISMIMALYGSCMLVGSITGSILIVELKSAYGWRNVFLIPAVIVGLFGLLVLFLGRSNVKPSDENNDSEENKPQTEENSKNKVEKLTPWKILCIPTIPEVSFSLFFTKGLKTAVLLWLPLYLLRVHKNDEKMSGLVPLVFEIGGLIGSIVLVMFFSNLLKWSDLFSSFISAIVCVAGFPLLLLSETFDDWFMYLVLLITGAFSSVIEIGMCGSLPSKIGEKIGARSSVVGVVNGLGSLGNGVEGPIVAWLTHFFGIQVLVYVLTGFSIITSLFLLKGYITSKRVDLYKD